MHDCDILVRIHSPLPAINGIICVTKVGYAWPDSAQFNGPMQPSGEDWLVSGFP